MTKFGLLFEKGDWIVPARGTPSAPQWVLQQHISVQLK
jgi:hypothetical protein